MLWASPPDDGADADGRFDVDSVLVTEFLLSFVGTLAGLKLSSDIAACIQRARRFRAFRPGRSQRGYLSVTDAPQRVIAARRPVLLPRHSNRSRSSTARPKTWQPTSLPGNPAVGCRLQNNVKGGTASLFVKGGKSPLAQHTKKKLVPLVLARLEEAAKTQERWRHLLLNDVET